MFEVKHLVANKGSFALFYTNALPTKCFAEGSKLPKVKNYSS